MLRRGAAHASGELLPGANARIMQWCRQRLQQLNSDFPFDVLYGDSGTVADSKVKNDGLLR